MNLPSGLYSEDFEEDSAIVIFCSKCNGDCFEIETNRKGECESCQEESED